MTSSELALAPDFIEFIASLNAQEVEFVLVGGYALAVHGFIRATADIDFPSHAGQCSTLVPGARRIWCAIRVDQLSGAARADIVTFFGSPPLRVDLLSSLSGVECDDVFRTAVHIQVADHRLLVIGRDTLVKNKRASGREKDVRDVRALMKDDRQKR